MRFELPEDALALGAGVRDMVSRACPPSVIRAAWPCGDGSAVEGLWRALGDLGLPGLLVPEAAGGLGASELAAVAALEECGHAGVPGPLVETVTCTAPLLASADPLNLLPAVLDGSARVAVQAESGSLVPYAVGSVAVLCLAPPAEILPIAGAAVTGVDTVDGSRALAQVAGEGATLEVDPTALDLARRRAELGTAAFLHGLARRQRDLTVAYVSDRQQFGVPVGSFQAVKHPLADATVGLEFSWPAILRAAASLASGDPSAGLHVSMAKALTSDAAWRMSRVCLQAHGAMGYTVEYDLHLYAKRTWALAYAWGSATEHRGRVAAQLGLHEGMRT